MKIYIRIIPVFFKISPPQQINIRETKNIFSCEGKEYVCKPCSKQLSKKGDLAEHKIAVHQGVKHLCRQCGNPFLQRGNLVEHHRTVHEGVRYPCGQCGKQFSSC